MKVWVVWAGFQGSSLNFLEQRSEMKISTISLKLNSELERTNVSAGHCARHQTSYDHST